MKIRVGLYLYAWLVVWSKYGARKDKGLLSMLLPFVSTALF